jgi:tRNA(Ile)-lysidine synthase
MTDATVAIRNAVKPFLSECEAGDVILVAVSGGADSLALADAILKEAKPLAITAIGVTVDHQLQSNSGAQAEKVQSQLKELGYGKVICKKVVVDTKSGLEAGARDARYQALAACAKEEKAEKIFLGHTRDDQAETVLLGLARGSGTRSLSGMATINGMYIRPLLAITRRETEQACKERGIDFWVDPHNSHTEFSRVKVRTEVLPHMEAKIGPGIAAALARSAAILRDDADALDSIAEEEISEVSTSPILIVTTY